MIQAALDIVGWVGLVGGGAFVIIGALGLVRLPDVYSRLHAAGITDTLGAWPRSMIVSASSLVPLKQ